MKIEEIEIPDHWCAELAALQVYDQNAMIAGGAIRDLYFGRVHKDVDVFSTLFINESNDNPDIDYEGMSYVIDVATKTKDDTIYNSIMIEPGITNEQLLESFDLGFCQIGFDGVKLIKTSAFLWDAKHGIITLRHIDRYSRSIRRYARINERYDRDLIIPELEPKVITDA